MIRSPIAIFASYNILFRVPEFKLVLSLKDSFPIVEWKLLNYLSIHSFSFLIRKFMSFNFTITQVAVVVAAAVAAAIVVVKWKRPKKVIWANCRRISEFKWLWRRLAAAAVVAPAARKRRRARANANTACSYQWQCRPLLLHRQVTQTLNNICLFFSTRP